MSKLNFNATGTQITGESHSYVGASEFTLDHGLFLSSGFLVTKSGAPLTYGTDYILTTINERLRTEAGITVYQKVKVLNVTYQSGELLFTYKAVGDFINVEDGLQADTVDGLHANDNAITDNDTTLATKNKVKTYADMKIAKATNVTAIDDAGIADGEIAVFNLTAKSIKTSDKVFSTDGTLAGNSDANIPTQKAVKTYADNKIAKATNVTLIDDTGIADGEIAVFNLTAKSIKTSDKVFSTDGTLAGNSDANIPTEKAVKTYADNKIAKAGTVIQDWIALPTLSTWVNKDTALTAAPPVKYEIQFRNSTAANVIKIDNNSSYIESNIAKPGSYFNITFRLLVTPVLNPISAAVFDADQYRILVWS